MVKYPKAEDFHGAVPVGTWGEASVPIFDVPNMHALNQLVGYIKHINAGEGTVLYRGQCHLHEHIIPSIKHDISREPENQNRLQEAISKILCDDPLKHFFGFRNQDIAGWELYQKLVIEAALQHYMAKTYCVDFVDNHWTALWFGIYQWDSVNKQFQKRINSFHGEHDAHITKNASVQKKPLPKEPTLDDITLSEAIIAEIEQHAAQGSVSYEELEERYKQALLKGERKKWKKACQQIEQENQKIDAIEKTDHLFLFLYVAETNVSNLHGVYMGEETYTVDLRKALPSTLLRPCAQHGWVVKGKQEQYQFDKNISCVIRIGVDLAEEMLGNGLLLSQENFFPDKETDQGYNILLQRQIRSKIPSKYKKILPEDMITVLD